MCVSAVQLLIDLLVNYEHHAAQFIQNFNQIDDSFVYSVVLPCLYCLQHIKLRHHCFMCFKTKPIGWDRTLCFSFNLRLHELNSRSIHVFLPHGTGLPFFFLVFLQANVVDSIWYLFVSPPSKFQAS